MGADMPFSSFMPAREGYSTVFGIFKIVSTYTAILTSATYCLMKEFDTRCQFNWAI